MNDKQNKSCELRPKLRFPEFREAGEWEETKLGMIAEVLPGYGFPEIHQGKNEGKYPFYKVSDISNSLQKGECFINEAVNYIDEETLQTLKAKLIPVGTTIFARIGEAIRSNRRAITTTLCVIDNNVAGLKRLEEKSLDLFVYYLLSEINLVDYAGGVVPAVNKSAIENIPIACPNIPEQQKIADCLSSIDELITLEAQKLDVLKTHKKGLMQQFFPAEGETLPKLRFPEFREAGEWTNALLGNLLIGSPDYGVNAAAVPFADNLPKYLRITDISEEGRYLPDKQVSVDLDATDQNYLDEGDIVLARTGASVGKSYRYRKEDGKLVFAGFLIRVKPDPMLLISTYLANFLTTDHFWKWVAVTSARSGQPGINSTEYGSLAIPLPPNLSEQQKIADCLSSLDDLITAQTQQLAALKTHKKGLMQQLFPSFAEGRKILDY